MYSATNSTTFLSYFNRIDSFLGKVVGQDAYMPFAEKVDHIAKGNYAVSYFVRTHQTKLKYFGDLRNQVVHGFGLDQHHYLLASDYAIQQIKHLQEALEKPPTVEHVFTRNIVPCFVHTVLREAINQMKTARIHYLPIYGRDNQFKGFLSERMIVWSGEGGEHTDLSTETVARAMREDTREGYLFLSLTTSVYEIAWVFAQQREKEKELAVVFLTSSGSPMDPITGYITAADLPKITEIGIL